MLNQKKFSVVIPVYNEKDSLEELCKRIQKIFSDSADYEIILIDDGSTDGSDKEIKSLSENSKNIFFYFLHAHQGKSAALTKGFKQAKGDIVITMDADLQDIPEEIPKFTELLKNGNYDFVNGWRYKRLDNPVKKFLSKIYNWVTYEITGINIHDMNCGFKAFKKEIAGDIILYGELHRYFIVIAKSKGYKIGEVKINHSPRVYGKSKYTYNRIIKGFLDLLTVIFLTKFLNSPLYLFGSLSIVFFALSIIGIVYYEIIGFYGFFSDNQTVYLASRIREILAVILSLFGLLFLSIGLICQLILHLFINKYKQID